MMEIKIVAPITQTHRIVVRASSVMNLRLEKLSSLMVSPIPLQTEKMLDEALEKGEDLTKYCTSKVTDMSGMFNQMLNPSTKI